MPGPPASDCDRRPIAAAQRIIDLLDAVGVDEPAILVGHSLGGIHVRAAALLAPERVAGLVLVDPSHEGMLAVVENSREAAATRGVLRFTSFVAPLGVGRLAGRAFSRLALAEVRQTLEPDVLEGTRTSGLLTSRTAHGLKALSAENGALVASLRQFEELVRDSPPIDVPLTVITAAAPSDNARVTAARAEIDELHAQLVAASPQGRHVFAERSGHVIPLDDPEIIVRCVRESAAAINAPLAEETP